MRRREVLASGAAVLGAGVAGCSGGGSGQYTPTTSGTPTERPDAYRLRNYEASVEPIGPRGTHVIDTTRWRKWELPDDVAVKAVADIDPGPAKDLVREAILDETHALDERPPQRVLDLLSAYDFFYLPRENLPFPYYKLRLFRFPDGTPRLSLSVEPQGRTLTREDPVDVRFRLENPSDSPREIHAGAVPPFGVPTGVRNGKWQVVLWRDEYGPSNYVFVHEHYVRTRDRRERVVVDPGETLGRTYRLRPGRPNFGPGRYTFEERLKHAPVTAGPAVFLDYAFSFDLVPA